MVSRVGTVNLAKGSRNWGAITAGTDAVAVGVMLAKPANYVVDN